MIIAKTVPVILPRYVPPTKTPASTSNILTLLDDWFTPGVPLSQFHAHIVTCECGLVMTTRSFDKHRCLLPLEGPSSMTVKESVGNPSNAVALTARGKVAEHKDIVDLTDMDEDE